MHWYAIHTKPRQEELAESGLRAEGFETFLPRLRQKKRVRRKYQWVTGPLFPRYLFAWFDYTTCSRQVRYARGVSAVVSFGGKPAVVDPAIIEGIRRHCVGEVVVLEPPELRPGDKVIIQEGPFSGLQGIFERNLTGSERVVILLECIAAAARVEVARDCIERL